MANAENSTAVEANGSGNCTGLVRDESMRRMMSFVEPLGHSQIVDRQSLASLPVGFVKLSITDDSKVLKVRMVNFMKSLSSRKLTANYSAPSGKSQANPAIAQVSIKGYLAANNLVFESKATSDQTNSAGNRANSLLFDKREILSSLDKRSNNQDNNAAAVGFFHSEQVLQVCIFTYPAPYRMKTFLGTVHIAIADMRCSCNGHVNLSSFYKIFPTSSFVAGCPVIGVAPHCVNRCHIKNGSPLDKLCEDATATKTTKKAATTTTSAAAATTSNSSKLRLSQLAHASSTINATRGANTSSSSAPTGGGGHITKSHSLRAIVSALTHRRRVITNTKPPTTSTGTAAGAGATGRNKIESDVSLDNGYGSSSGDNCSRSSNVKLNDMHHHHSFSASSPRGARLCYRRSEPSFAAASIPASPRSSRLVAQTSIDSVRSFAGSSSNATDSSEDALSSGPCVCGAECCPPGMYDGLNYFSVSTGAIGCSSTAPRTRRKTITAANSAAGAAGKGKAMSGIVSSMKTLVYSVRLRTRLANRGKDGKGTGGKLSARPTTAVPSSLRSFSLGPLTDKDEYDDEKDNVFEVLASLKKIRFQEDRVKKDTTTTTTSSSETTDETSSSKPGSFDDEGKTTTTTTTTTSSDDGISFAVIDPHDPIVTLATSTWSCEECILASLAEKSLLTSSSNLLHQRASPRHRSTRNSSTASAASRRLVRQKCFRSSDDVSSSSHKITTATSSGESSSKHLTSSQQHHHQHKVRLAKLKPVVDDDIAPYVEAVRRGGRSSGGGGGIMLRSPCHLDVLGYVGGGDSMTLSSDDDEEEEDFHSCTGGDLYVDNNQLMSLSSSYQSLNCNFVATAEDVYVR